MGLDDREYRQNDSWKKSPQNEKNKKEFNSNKEKMSAEEIRSYYEQIEQIRNKNNPINKNRKNVTKNQEQKNNWIFIIPVIMLVIAAIIKNAYNETNEPTQQITQITQAAEPGQKQNNQIIYRAPTPEEEQEYMKEHNLIKLGNEYHWCGIKDSKDILPITKALDMDCQDDFCKIQKYYDYVKRIPYEKGTQGKDKNAIEVMEEWKGDCDERSDLLASMMLANGYKAILLYTKDHALTALNIPNYESNDNRAYIQYQERKYYIAETTNQSGQIGAYNDEVMHNLKYIYDVNEKRVTRGEEIAIQLYK